MDSITDLNRLAHSDPYDDAAVAFADAHGIDLPTDPEERAQWVADEWDRIVEWQQ